MAYEYRNLAYDLRLFEEEEIFATSVQTPEKEKAKHQPKKEKLNTDVNQTKKKEQLLCDCLRSSIFVAYCRSSRTYHSRTGSAHRA